MNEFKDEIKVLGHINEIEDPTNLDKVVQIRAVVASTSITYSAPAVIKVNEGRLVEIASNDPIILKLVNVSAEIQYKRLYDYLTWKASPEKVEVFKTEKFRAVYWLKVRPEIFSLQTMDGKVVDESGQEYKSIDAFVVAERQISFQPSSVVLLTGKVVPNPRSQTLTLLTDSVEFPEETDSFDLEKLATLKAKLDSFPTVDAKVSWILNNFQDYSGIVSRRNLAFAGALAHFSPLFVKLNGEMQRGWANVLEIGDSTVGKSATEQKWLRLLRGGAYITAETASAVGLIGSAVQKDKGGWYVDWGFLPLQDRKLLAIDGCHKLSMANWASLAESERSGIVTIAKAAKEQTHARTRQVKIANALDRETWQTKNLSDFLYNAQAVESILDKVSIARLDLAVFANSSDITAEEVNKIHSGEFDKELELLVESQKFARSPKINIEFTKEAFDLILSSATVLYNQFHVDNIPLVSIDQKYKLARLSAALALLTLSTENFETVTVTEYHVTEIFNFIREEYTKAGLNVLRQLAQNETLDPDEIDWILLEISNSIDKEGTHPEGKDPAPVPKVTELLKHLVFEGRTTKATLKSKFGFPEKNILVPLLFLLQEKGLIRGGKGYYTLPKLIQLWRMKFATLATIATVKKEPPIPPNPPQKDGGSSFQGGKESKDGKIEAFVK